MRTRILILTFAVLVSIPLLSQFSLAVPEEDSGLPRPELSHPDLYKLHTIKKTLKCGDAELTAESTCFHTTDTSRTQCRKQTINLKNENKGINKKLNLDGKMVKKHFKESLGLVLDGIVTSMGCLESASGNHFVVLWYVCNWGRDCTEQGGEWQRYFTLEGINLTIGDHNNVPYNRIFKKYGIPEKGGTYIELTRD